MASGSLLSRRRFPQQRPFACAVMGVKSNDTVLPWSLMSTSASFTFFSTNVITKPTMNINQDNINNNSNVTSTTYRQQILVVYDDHDDNGNEDNEQSKLLKSTGWFLSKSKTQFVNKDPVVRSHDMTTIHQSFVHRSIITSSSSTSNYDDEYQHQQDQVLLKNVDDQESELVSEIERFKGCESYSMYRAKDILMDSMEKLDSGYTEEQMQTIHIALTNKISKITGGPGT